MSSLKYYDRIFKLDQLDRLQERKIKTVFDFLQETPESIGNITKLHFKEVLEIKQKLLEACQSKSRSGFELYEEFMSNYFVIRTGITEIDKLLTGGLQSESVYEICGLSGSGKTQLCLGIAAHVSLTGKCVHYVDTKGDFSAKRIFQILIKKYTKTDVIASLGRIKVTKVYNLHQLINVLHWLKNLLSCYHIPLIIIDCISTLYFLSLGSHKPTGLPLLNHAASLMKFISLEYHTVVVVTNLATKYFSISQSDESRTPEQPKATKPCLGNYWRQVCNIRINVKNEKNSVINVSLDKNDFYNCTEDPCFINLHGN